MEFIDHLALGFSVALLPANLFWCFCGVLLGTLVGVLPGVGPITAIALLLPISFSLSSEAALIMLAGIYYGASYGGSTTAILVNIPGETSSVVTCLDGHAMARQGRAGAALATAAIGSFIAGTIATVIVALFGPLLSSFALSFGPSEYFSLMVLGLVGAAVLAQGSLLKAFGTIMLGLLLGTVGTDSSSTFQRFTFGIQDFFDGLGFVPVAMGLFGLAEILVRLQDHDSSKGQISRVGSLMLTWQEWCQAWKPILRGTAMGSILGILPGGGATLGAFASYALEKRIAAKPERFGRGAIEGVAGPESANNAGAQTSFIPLLTLGLPSNAIMGLMVGAMMIQGIAPGPQVMTEKPALFWGMIASMWVGNLMLLVLNLPLVGMWVKVLSIPYRWLFPGIILICAVGTYSLNLSIVELWVFFAFGILGFVLTKLGCEPAPLILAFVLGPMMEENLRRALLLFKGNVSGFLNRPLSLTILALAIALLIVVIVPSARKTREEAFQE